MRVSLDLFLFLPHSGRLVNDSNDTTYPLADAIMQQKKLTQIEALEQTNEVRRKGSSCRLERRPFFNPDNSHSHYHSCHFFRCAKS
jgi:hypothetical protein